MKSKHQEVLELIQLLAISVQRIAKLEDLCRDPDLINYTEDAKISLEKAIDHLGLFLCRDVLYDAFETHYLGGRKSQGAKK